MKQLIFALCLALPLSANARLITISTPDDVMSQPSYTFDNYILELVNPANIFFNLINDTEDFIVSDRDFAGDFTLRRLDNSPFSLTSVRIAGVGPDSMIGGVSVPAFAYPDFQSFLFSGQAGVTGVSSVLFSPNNVIQLAAFEVRDSVPVPATLALLGIGLFGLGWSTRRNS